MKTVIFKKGQKVGDLNENDKARLFQTTVKGMDGHHFLSRENGSNKKGKGKIATTFLFKKMSAAWGGGIQKQMPSINKKLDVYPLPISL